MICKLIIPEEVYNKLKNNVSVYFIYYMDGTDEYTYSLPQDLENIVGIWKIVSLCSDYKIECRNGKCKVKVVVEAV